MRDELRDELHYNVIIDHIKPSTLASQRAQSIYQFLLSQDLSSKRLKLLKLKEVEVQENNWV
ncbi:MAG: hypothetical protein Rpha_0850 [Candidatus Ruthia sp. Apha_13_S6]|nr:hypothetical protein [Candidatus Ruthia sp. Apha_13_S6]